MKPYRIVIDTLGSDQGPESVIKGAAMLLKKHPEILLTLVGDKDLIIQNIAELGMNPAAIKIVDAPETITNKENVGEAFFKKPNASILKAIQECANDESTIGLLTAGNSGAILMGAMKYLTGGTISRPCLSSILPSEKGGFVCIVDCGATLDVTKSQLHQFAQIGSDFMRRLYKIEAPKIALLSNGAEDTKGNKLVKETFPLLKEDASLNFIGNVEGSNALSGVCDVVVCDGFVGNQLLKATEAAATRVIKDVVKYIRKNGRDDMMPLVQSLMGTYDMSNLGGAIVLGTIKPIIKCHGCAGSEAFMNTADLLINLEEGKSFFGDTKFVVTNEK